MIVTPFVFLGEFIAHEKELLTRMSEHEAVVCTQIGEALPGIARHPAQDRALAMHDLVMGQREDEIFKERIMQAEKNLSVLIFPVDWILADIVQRVVHPAHIPLVAKSESAPANRARHH